MTLTYGFYDSSSGDRVYTAKQLSSVFDGVVGPGIYGNIGDKFMVVEDSPPSLDVIVGTGRAWLDHTWTLNDADISITLSTPDAILDRIDVIYIEVNEDVGTRANKIDILTGTPASTPVAPTLTNTSVIHQYPLAHIYVAAQASAITQASITNKVGTDDTPFVAAPATFVTLNEVLAQWETEWEEWFLAIQGQLTTEAETNLQAQIYAIVGDVNPPTIDLIEVKQHNHDGTDTVQVATNGLANGAVTNIKIGSDAVTADKIAAGAVGTSELANNSVDDLKAGPRVPFMYRRQGQSSTDWWTPGTTTQIPGAVKMQSGCISLGIGQQVTFPVPFTGDPLVFVTTHSYNHAICVTGTYSTYFTARLYNIVSGVEAAGIISWLAIGNE